MTTGAAPSGRTTANSRQRRPVRQTAQRRPASSIAARSSSLIVFTVLNIAAQPEQVRYVLDIAQPGRQTEPAMLWRHHTRREVPQGRSPQDEPGPERVTRVENEAVLAGPERSSGDFGEQAV